MRLLIYYTICLLTPSVSCFCQKDIGINFRAAPDSVLIGEYLKLADNDLKKKNYSDALHNYQKAIPLLLRSGDEYRLAQVYKNAGDIYSARSYFRQAFDSYRDALPLLRKTGQLQLTHECQDAMGNLALDYGDPQNALNFYRRSLALKASIKDDAGVVAGTLKLSKIHLLLKQYDSALFYCKEVQSLSRDNMEVFSEALIDEMVILSFLGKLKEAETIKVSAETIVKQQSNPSNHIRLIAAISNFYTAQKNKQAADKYFDSARVLIMTAKSPELAVAGLGMLADMHIQNGDYLAAYNMVRMMDKYKDIFRNENIERISAEIKNAAEISLKEKEIIYLQMENQLKAEKLNKETALRLALLRHNMLIDSSLVQQKELTKAKEIESALRKEQLKKEKDLSLSLSRENQLKHQGLENEIKNKRMLWYGITLLAILSATVLYQFRRQLKKNILIKKQSGELMVLNKEVHHRVKNNLQVISSLLDLQLQTLKDENARSVVGECVRRVHSMAFIHQNLYQGQTVSSVNMREYNKMLCDHLFQSYNITQDKIILHTEIEELNLSTDTAIPLGMILNELISNSLKYAFKGKETGHIWVSIQKGGGELFVQVKDDGIGLPANFNADTDGSFGYEIIRAFAQKLRARMQVETNNGTDVKLIVSKFKTSA